MRSRVQASVLQLRLPERSDCSERRGDVADRAVENKRIVLGGSEPASHPESRCFIINCIHDEDGGEALFLIRKGSRLQPAIKRRLAAREIGNVVRSRERLRKRERQRAYLV